MDTLAKFLRGDFFSPSTWKYIIVIGVMAFVMVYLSASMDQKVYKISRLTTEKNSLSTHYVEIISEISQVRMKGGELEYFQKQGFSTADRPVYMITVKKQQ